MLLEARWSEARVACSRRQATDGGRDKSCCDIRKSSQSLHQKQKQIKSEHKSHTHTRRHVLTATSHLDLRVSHLACPLTVMVVFVFPFIEALTLIPLCLCVFVSHESSSPSRRRRRRVSWSRVVFPRLCSVNVCHAAVALVCCFSRVALGMFVCVCCVPVSLL